MVVAVPEVVLVAVVVEVSVLPQSHKLLNNIFSKIHPFTTLQTNHGLFE